MLLRLDAAAGSAIGIDFGHRHVRVAVADLSSAVLAEQLLDAETIPYDNSNGEVIRSCLFSSRRITVLVSRNATSGATAGLSGP